jgi:hypothetical protein
MIERLSEKAARSWGIGQKPERLAWVALAMMLIALSPPACKSIPERSYYSTTAQARVQPGVSFTEGKLAAIQRAENRARDQILQYVMGQTFTDGSTLEEAVITDPFIRARVYDAIRTAKITDQTINDEGMVTVTLRLDMEPIHAILADIRNAGTNAKDRAPRQTGEDRIAPAEAPSSNQPDQPK